MADDDLAEGEALKPSKKKPLILGLVLAIVMGGGGFYAMYSGMLGGSSHKVTDDHGDDHGTPTAAADVAFVALDPLIISLGPAAANRHLRFAAQLEVTPKKESSVTALTPRVLDVLNGYLRAVDITDLEDPSALIRLRAQMLRRVQVVTGEGQVRDLLITEFVLN